MEKQIACQNCEKVFTPDDENDIYCCEDCLNQANGISENDGEMGEDNK